MSTVLDFLNSLRGGGLKVNSTPKYINPSGGGTNSPTHASSGVANTAPNYINPLSAPSEIAPITYNPSGSYTDYSAPSDYGYYGDPAVAYDPETDPAKRNPLIADLQSKWNTLQSVYNSLFGQVDNYAKDATKRITDAYDTQQNADVNNFNKTQNLTASMYAGRGLGDSSYLGDAQGQNAELFNQGLAQNAINRENQLAQIGQQVAGQKAQLTASKNAYAPYINNLSQYGVSDLMGLQGNLQQAIGNANTTAAGIGTNSDFINKLNAVTPLESQASSQLAAKLKNLTLSSAPAAAKKYVALGLIKANTLNDQNAQSYWQSYFDQLLNGQA